MIRTPLVVITLLAAFLAVVAWFSAPTDHDHSQHGHGDKRTDLRALSYVAERGRSLFSARCATCRGNNGTGTDKGSLLPHDIHVPGLRNDLSFQRAAGLGARAHYRPSGDMPPVASISGAHVTGITAFIRDIQRANGIFWI